MARIRMGLDIRTMRGRFDGHSYRVRGATGTVGVSGAKRRGSSDAQIAWRKLFKETVGGWNDLSEVDRGLWNVWADLYGTAADPDAPVGASGRSRFIGANTMQRSGGRPLILSPRSPGIGNADAGLLAVFPIEGTILAEVQMLETYPGPEIKPAWMAVYASPVQRESSPSNKNRWRKVDDIQVTRGGPTGSFPIRIMELDETVDRGQMIWIKTRVVTGAGNTSSNAVWPIFMAGINELRAFRMQPVFDFFSPQRYRIAANELVIEFSAAADFDTQIVYDLTNKSVNTIGKLFARINTDGIWKGLNFNAAVTNRPSIELIEVVNTNVTTGQQPSLLRVPE